MALRKLTSFEIKDVDEVELFCTLFVWFKGDIKKAKAWLIAMNHEDLTHHMMRRFSEINARYNAVRKALFTKLSQQALYDEVNNPKSTKKVQAAQQLLLMAEADTTTPEGKSIYDRLRETAQLHEMREARRRNRDAKK